MLQYGPLKTEVLLQPVSGKALPVLRGEVIRIIQEEGGQCVDFNAFNLHDYKEYLGASNTRSRNAFRVKKGDIIWSVSSRDRPMFVILEIAETCRTDLKTSGATLSACNLGCSCMRSTPFERERVLYAI